jgi:hypothetical protein
MNGTSELELIPISETLSDYENYSPWMGCWSIAGNNPSFWCHLIAFWQCLGNPFESAFFGVKLKAEPKKLKAELERLALTEKCRCKKSLMILQKFMFSTNFLLFSFTEVYLRGLQHIFPHRHPGLFICEPPLLRHLYFDKQQKPYVVHTLPESSKRMFYCYRSPEGIYRPQVSKST